MKKVYIYHSHYNEKTGFMEIKKEYDMLGTILKDLYGR
jgi:hypothetical protein